MMRNWISIVEAIEDFGTTPTLYHGTNLDNLWLIIRAGKLSANFHGRGYEGPTGVCLSRSFKVALDHAQSWTENLGSSFFEYFNLGEPPKMQGVVLEFERKRIQQEIIPFDDLHDDIELEERVIGDLPLGALIGIHVNPDDVRTFVSYAIKSYKEHQNEYDAEFEKIIEQVLADPRLKAFKS